MKLLDVQMVQGIYIDRKKNGTDRDNFAIDEQQSTNDKVVFVRSDNALVRNKHESEFELVKRDKQFKTDSDMSFMQVEIEFTSNLRLGLEHEKASDKLFSYPPKFLKREFETHFLRFERYVQMPLEMRLLKDKMVKEAQEDIDKAQKLR